MWSIPQSFFIKQNISYSRVGHCLSAFKDKYECAGTHSFAKQTLRRFRETCKPGHFLLHIWGMVWHKLIEPSQQICCALTCRNLPLAFPLTLWPYFVCRVSGKLVSWALLLFVFLPPSVLSSPPLPGARFWTAVKNKWLVLTRPRDEQTAGARTRERAHMQNTRSRQLKNLWR